MNKNSTNTKKATVNDVYTANKLLSNTLASWMNALVYNAGLNTLKKDYKDMLETSSADDVCENIKVWTDSHKDLLNKVDFDKVSEKTDGICKSIDTIATYDELKACLDTLKKEETFINDNSAFQVFAKMVASDSQTQKAQADALAHFLKVKFDFVINDKLAKKLIKYCKGYNVKGGNKLQKAIYDGKDDKFTFIDKRSTKQVERLLLGALTDLCYDKTLKKAQLLPDAVAVLDKLNKSDD